MKKLKLLALIVGITCPMLSFSDELSQTEQPYQNIDSVTPSLGNHTFKTEITDATLTVGITTNKDSDIKIVTTNAVTDTNKCSLLNGAAAIYYRLCDPSGAAMTVSTKTFLYQVDGSTTPFQGTKAFVIKILNTDNPNIQKQQAYTDTLTVTVQDHA